MKTYTLLLAASGWLALAATSLPTMPRCVMALAAATTLLAVAPGAEARNPRAC